MGGAEARLFGNLSTFSASSAKELSSTQKVERQSTPVDLAAAPAAREEQTVTPSQALDLTLTAGNSGMTPQVASRLEKGYVVFGLALLAMAGLAIVPRVRRRTGR
jgi:hypothetical protein